MNEDKSPEYWASLRQVARHGSDGMVYLVVLEFEDTEGVEDAYWSYEHECDIDRRVAGVFDSEESLQQVIETQLHGLKVGETRLSGRVVLGGYVLAMPLNRFAQSGWIRDL